MKSAINREFTTQQWADYMTACQLSTLKRSLLRLGSLNEQQISLINFVIKNSAKYAAKAPKFNKAA